jgi:hypothetical protein
MDSIPPNFNWPEPWKPLPFPDGLLGRVESVESELRSEVSQGHLLYRVDCKAVACNADDPNEFLFITARPNMPLAFVHLTWKAEREPNWPYTVGYPSWEAFQKAWESAED